MSDTAKMPVQRFRRTPEVVEAMHFDSVHAGSLIAAWTGGSNEQSPHEVRIENFHQGSGVGFVDAKLGDWVLRDEEGLFYRYRADQFNDQYQAAPEAVERDEQIAALEDERDRLRRSARHLGNLVAQMQAQVLDATKSHDLIDEDGDGDWKLLWERLTELGRNQAVIRTTEEIEALPKGALIEHGGKVYRNRGFIQLWQEVDGKHHDRDSWTLLPALLIWTPEEKQ